MTKDQKSRKLDQSTSCDVSTQYFDIGGDKYVVLSYDLKMNNLEFDELTSSEQEVLQFVIEGFSNNVIAQRRNTSIRTVANQLASIYRKLGVFSRTELMSLLNQRLFEK